MALVTNALPNQVSSTAGGPSIPDLPDDITQLFLKLNRSYWNTYTLVSKHWYRLICNLEKELQSKVLLEAKKRFIEQQAREGSDFSTRVENLVSSLQSKESRCEIRKSCMAIHQVACEELEKAFPFIKTLNNAANCSYSDLCRSLSLPENRFLKDLIPFCCGWYHGFSTCQLVTVNWAVLGQHPLAFNVLNNQRLFPLNSSWKINGVVGLNSTYDWIRCRTLHSIVLCLIHQKKTVELLLLLGREFKNLVGNKLFWGALVHDSRMDVTPSPEKTWKQAALEDCLEMGPTLEIDEIEAKFAHFGSQVTEENLYDLILGLALLFPEDEVSVDDDNILSPYFQALELFIGRFIEDSPERKKWLEYLSIIVQRINYDEKERNEGLEILEQMDYRIEKGFREEDYSRY